jgi:WS/DGAT/MGAT family acyltransferase
MHEGRLDTQEPGALHRLSGLDAIFVYAETPSMPMHTMGTMILDTSAVPGGFGFSEIVSTVESRLHLLPPFRRRLLEPPLGVGHPVLVDDPHFRLENHLHRCAVPEPGGLRELAELVGELAGRRLDRSQPLWEMWAVEGLEGGRIGLVTKLHHCMIDGASGSSQMAGLLDLERAPGPVGPAPEPWNPPPLPTPFSLARRSAGSRLVGPRHLGRLLARTATGLLRRRRAVREVARRHRELLDRSQPVPATPFNGALTRHRSVAYGSAALGDIKRIRKAFGVTVNDVVLAAFALALRRYLIARDALPAEPLACAVPVSLKTETEKQELSNKVATMTVRLPTHLESPEEMLSAVQGESEDAKRVFQALDESIVPGWLELAPPLLTSAGARLYSDLDLADSTAPMLNLAISNMKGPPVPLYFGGARVDAVYPMGPVGEGMGLNITVLSNMGRVDVGVLACRERVREPWEIAEGFSSAVAALLTLVEARVAGDRDSPRDRPAERRTGT